MRRGFAKAAATGLLSLSLLCGKAQGQAYTANAMMPAATTEALANAPEEPPIAVYSVIRQKDGKEKEIGKAYIREHSLDATLFKIFNITFSQPNDSTYREEANVPILLGAAKETFTYEKDSVWRFTGYGGSLFQYRDEKKALEGKAYPSQAMTQLELLESLITGSLPDTSVTFVMAEQYRLPKLVEKRMGNQYFLKLDFLDLKEAKNDKIYLNDPASGRLDHSNIPLEANLILTEVYYRKGVRVEEKIPARLVLEYVDRERFLQRFQREVPIARQQLP